MGIVYVTNGDAMVFEAVEPVKMTALDEWTARGDRGHFVVKRLSNARQILTNDALDRMKEAGRAYVRRPYDLYFEWSDERIYCSELVWAVSIRIS